MARFRRLLTSRARVNTADLERVLVIREGVRDLIADPGPAADSAPLDHALAGAFSSSG